MSQAVWEDSTSIRGSPDRRQCLEPLKVILAAILEPILGSHSKSLLGNAAVWDATYDA